MNFYLNTSRFNSLVYAVCAILLYSCAQVGMPSGGKRDLISPRVTKYLPDSANINFNSKSIIISFDEYIHLVDLNNQLIVSPPLEKTPEIKVKDKSVIITIDKNEQLKPNTTYVFSFGSAIQDINENNPKENFKYIFSTGAYIDSLIVNGKVQNAFDHKTDKNILVMLYRNYTDSSIYKDKPNYFAKTKEDGTFEITNIREGKYKIIALKDKNANYKYDKEVESIAFIDSLITVPLSNKLVMELFQEPVDKLYFKKYVYNSYGKIALIFNKSPDSVKINSLRHEFKQEDVLLNYSSKKDTLNYWFRNNDDDSLFLQVSNGYKVLDTIEIKLIKKEDAFKSNKNPLKLSLLSSPDKNMNFDLGAVFTVTFSAPIDKKSMKDIVLKQDSLVWKSEIKELEFDFLDYKNLSKLALSSFDYSEKETEDTDNSEVVSQVELANRFTDWKENTNYDLFIPPETFTDFFGLTNDSINIRFKTREAIYYGSLKLELNIVQTKNNYIVQLLDEQENVVRENNIQSSETIKYEYLYPGKYKLKIIYDTNKNWKWDIGNVVKNQQPEKVIYNAELINIRSNWDLELKWEVKE